ncbi:MAG TPA: hypothetical protein HPP77_00730 [Candidatus Hydrogenedentes bacterium]|nr:hypothetical protein [Candidatus Hydrogenedentota bacterium]HIJ74723.1 hypothetical protein [Candidatus Hydrogenedentota bacterium]
MSGRKLLLLIAAVIATLQCRGESPQEVLLRFSPEVGRTYSYAFSINLDKLTYNRLSNENVQAVFCVKVLEKEKDTYRTQWNVTIGDHNLSKPILDQMEDKVSESKVLLISDRYVLDKEDEQNLSFPDLPQREGAEWRGKCRFRFGDLLTRDYPLIDVDYKLAQISQGKDRPTCTIVCVPVAKTVEVPFQMGQLGIRLDQDARVSAVADGSGAAGIIQAGDVLIGINGVRAKTRRDRSHLAQRFVESPGDVEAEIILTILRNGEERDFVVSKSLVTLGTIRVKIEKLVRTVVFDTEEGIVRSDQGAATYAMTYHFLENMPFLDDFTGRMSQAINTQREVPPRIYNYEWEMTLLQRPES